MYSCKILLDSISEIGKRITTFEITFPRIVLAEFNTHRMFSRNSASSRAIPFKTQLERVKNNPFIPERWPVNDKGMQPNKYIEPLTKEHNYANETWLSILDGMINEADNLYNLFRDFDDNEVRIHKQIVNRLFEPFMWHTVIVTATEFDNFFKLRTHPDAQYEIKRIADLMYEAYHAFDNIENPTEDYSERKSRRLIFPDNNRLGLGLEWTAAQPQKLKVGEWHCPLVYDEDDKLIHRYLHDCLESESKYLSKGDYNENFTACKKQISVARCARVSYLTHEGKRDIEKDLELFERLKTSGHFSPFEHIATPWFEDFGGTTNDSFNEEEYRLKTFHIERYMNLRSGNFIGWKQMRKDLPNENCTNFRR